MEGETGDEVVSMLDVLQEDNDLEEEANAVLGDSDDQCCTYTRGYVNRQALYACNTCTPTESAGICLACSLTCHDGHDLYELYTKRNFRCDCGNSRFESTRCKLYPDKDATNNKNKYNQNFRGLYCTCHKPYPDPEDEIEDEMIQCVICEDWYHSRHLGSLPPADYQEMVCDGCMKRCSFLKAYVQLSASSQSSLGQSQQVITKEDKDNAVDVGKEASPNKNSTTDQDNKNNTASNTSATKTEEIKAETNPTKKDSPEDSKETTSSTKKESETTSCQCKLTQLQTTVKEDSDCTASFWSAKWRTELCSCDKCKELYKSHEVSFLLDDQDTMLAYEERGKQASKMTSYESGMQVLGNMQRINQVEAIQGYNDLKNELTEYLREFADQGKVVTQEDIRSFFDTMQSRKRQRVGSANTIQYQCK